MLVKAESSFFEEVIQKPSRSSSIAFASHLAVPGSTPVSSLPIHQHLCTRKCAKAVCRCMSRIIWSWFGCTTASCSTRPRDIVAALLGRISTSNMAEEHGNTSSSDTMRASSLERCNLLKRLCKSDMPSAEHFVDYLFSCQYGRKRSHHRPTEK